MSGLTHQRAMAYHPDPGDAQSTDLKKRHPRNFDMDIVDAFVEEVACQLGEPADCTAFGKGTSESPQPLKKGR